jgi:hypothetical protein
MLTLLALLAALLGPGPVLADNSGGGPVNALVASDGGPAAKLPASADAGGGGTTITITATVDDNSGGRPVHRK